MPANYKQIGILVAMTALLGIFPLNAAYSEKINCADDVDMTKYPICKYEDEWNISQQFNEKVVEEMANRADEINENPNLYYQLYQESIDKVDRENPGLQQICQDMKDWIHAQLRN